MIVQIRTKEPVADTNGKVWPAGTEALLTRFREGQSGRDFVTRDGRALFEELMPGQYEVVDRRGLRHK